jgi:hypothetical protein
MFVLAALMKSKKFLFLLSVGLALMLGISVLASSVSPTAFGQQQQQTTNTGGNQNATTGTTTTTNNTATSTAGTPLDCQMAASTLGGMVIPNPTGVCDVAVPRQGLQVQDNSTGASLNGMLVINPLFEFLPLSNQTPGGGTTGGNQTILYGFAEFALLEEELPSAMRMLSNSSWNVVAVHNHVTMETPKMIFVHAVGTSDISTLTRDARIFLDSLTTQMQSQQGNQTSITAGGGGTTAGNATNMTAAGNVTNATTAGNATNMTAAGNVTNATTAGNATNMTAAGNVTNATTAGNVTNATTAGNATNMTAAGNVTNATTAGNATNMTTGGDAGTTDGTEDGGGGETLGGIF